MLAAGLGWTLWAALWCCCVASRPLPDPAFPPLRRPHRYERADRPAEFRPPSGGRLAGGGVDSPERERCSLPTRDLVAKAPTAPAVIVAKVRSMSSDPRANLSVTFEVKRVLSRRNLTLKAGDHVRLQVSRGGCWGTPRAGNLYLLLVERAHSRAPSRALQLLAPPAAKSPALVKDIKTALKSHTASRPAGVVGLKDISARSGDKVSFTCRARGRPPPKIAWFKDKQPLRLQAKRIQQHTKRRLTELVIKHARPEDSGVYECQVLEEGTRQRVNPRSSKATLTVQEDPPNESKICPMPDPSSFCLNGGTCIFIEQVGEAACKCPDGYSGQRCENKNVSNHTSMYRPFTCTLGLTLSYYC